MSAVVLWYCKKCRTYVSTPFDQHNQAEHGAPAGPRSVLFLPVKELVDVPGRQRRVRTVTGFRCECGHVCPGGTVDDAQPAMEEHYSECPLVNPGTPAGAA